jgi:hypothetical protein
MEAAGTEGAAVESPAVEPTAMESTAMESTAMEPATAMESATAMEPATSAMRTRVGWVRLRDCSSEQHSSCGSSQSPSLFGPNLFFT